MRKQKDTLFLLVLVGIIVFSIFLRFYRFDTRWGLAHDQASFAIGARYALETHQLPAFGPFSSAGPFQTGGIWYWLVMVGTALFPPAVVSPWVFLTILSASVTPLLMLIAWKMIPNRWFSASVGLLAATSPFGVLQATNLTNQTPLPFFATLAIFFQLLYWQRSKMVYLFLTSMAVGVGSATHAQGFALLPVVAITFLVGMQFTLPAAIAAVAGFLIPWVSVFIAEARHGFFNTKSMLTYMFGKDKVPFELLGRRWLTFATQTTPRIWSDAVSGMISVSTPVAVSTGALVGLQTLTGKISLPIFITAFELALMLTIVRYTHTPLYESFTFFLHPFIILLSGYLVFFVSKKVAPLGVVLLILLVGANIAVAQKGIVSAENKAAESAYRWTRVLEERYPGETFTLFDYKYTTTGRSLPLLLTLYAQDRISDEGRLIGLGYDNMKFVHHPQIVKEIDGFRVYDLNATPNGELQFLGWGPINPQQIYESVQGWFLKK